MSAFSNTEQTTISPHTLQPLPGSTRVYPSEQELDAAITKASAAQKEWVTVGIKERVKIGRKFIVSPTRSAIPYPRD